MTSSCIERHDDDSRVVGVQGERENTKHRQHAPNHKGIGQIGHTLWSGEVSLHTAVRTPYSVVALTSTGGAQWLLAACPLAHRWDANTGMRCGGVVGRKVVGQPGQHRK